MMKSKIGLGLNAIAGLVMGLCAKPAKIAFRNRWDFECIGPDGKVKWRETVFNTTVGGQFGIQGQLRHECYCHGWGRAHQYR